MTGFESQNVWIHRQLWKLGRQAVELGLDDLFRTESTVKILSELESSEQGRDWLNRYHDFLMEHGWRCERQHAYDSPAWIEKPELALEKIKMSIDNDTFPSDAALKKAVEEREAATQRVLEKVPQMQRAAFEVLMKAAQKSGFKKISRILCSTVFPPVYIEYQLVFLVCEGQNAQDNDRLDDR